MKARPGSPDLVSTLWLSAGRPIVWLALGTHAFMAVCFAILEAGLPSVISMCSATSYGACLILALRRRYTAIGVLLTFAVLNQAVLASFATGLETRFQYTLILLAPLIFVVRWSSVFMQAALAASLTGIFIALEYALTGVTPRFVFSPYITTAIRGLNLALCLGSLAIVSHVWTRLMRESHARLAHIPGTDDVTGLPDRDAVLAILSREIARSTRTARPTSLALCRVQTATSEVRGDIRNGDALREVAATLTAHLRQHDSVARWDPDAFLVVLPETELETATRIAERLDRAVRANLLALEAGDPACMVTAVGEHAPEDRLEDTLAGLEKLSHMGPVQGGVRVRENSDDERRGLRQA